LTSMTSTQTYRPDVDGLRAVAVLAVLAFHAFPDLVPGGFAGVDVFFVISGFLITGIILHDLRSGSFTFLEFYRRRVRRIFPALILVLLACLAIGWLILLPDEFRQLGGHVAAGAAFVANIALWRESGYFATAAELKPLLHLWSLGVEEQYYVVWPLLLFLLRGKPRPMLAMILAVAAGSFAVNLWMTARTEWAAFYLPFGRFWELMAGSLLAYMARYGRLPQSYPNLKAWVGVALVAASLALLHGGRALPGAWAALPVVGAALLIWAGPGAWLNRNVLSAPALVWVGLVSYPLYLWHWPLLSYARIAQGGEPSTTWRLALCAASVVLAWLTYELVEKKIRFAKVASVKRRSFPALAASMAALGAAGVLALQSVLHPQSASVPLLAEISRAATDWDYRGNGVLRGDSDQTILLFGDSHMQQYLPRVRKLIAERTRPVRTVIFKIHNGCAPVPGIERPLRNCSGFVEEALRLARRPEVDTVVIAGSWAGFLKRPVYRVGDPDQSPIDVLAPENAWVLEGFERALHGLAQEGKRVVLVLSSPRGPAFDPKSFVRRAGLMVEPSAAPAFVPRSKATEPSVVIDERLKRIALAIGAVLIDPADWLCTASHCPTADELGRPLFMDGSHLRASLVRDRFSAIDAYVYLR
jgi:peptidoglycan/LPS O-acetylase OafA/YrhL